MLKPKYPTPDTAPTPTRLTMTAPGSVPATITPAPLTSAAARPTVQLTPGTALALVGGGTAVVLVVGAVLVSMLLAVAVTAVSVAVCAVVLRTMLSDMNKDR